MTDPQTLSERKRIAQQMDQVMDTLADLQQVADELRHTIERRVARIEAALDIYHPSWNKKNCISCGGLMIGPTEGITLCPRCGRPWK